MPKVLSAKSELKSRTLIIVTLGILGTLAHFKVFPKNFTLPLP